MQEKATPRQEPRDYGIAALRFNHRHGIWPSDFDPTGILSNRAILVLARHGLDLRSTPYFSDDELLLRKGIGPVTVRRIREAEEELGDMTRPWAARLARLRYRRQECVSRIEGLRECLESIPSEIAEIEQHIDELDSRIRDLGESDP